MSSSDGGGQNGPNSCQLSSGGSVCSPLYVLLAVLNFTGSGFSGTASNWAVSHPRRRITRLLRGWTTSRRLTADVWATWVGRWFGDVWRRRRTHIIRLSTTTIAAISYIKQQQLHECRACRILCRWLVGWGLMALSAQGWLYRAYCSL